MKRPAKSQRSSTHDRRGPRPLQPPSLNDPQNTQDRITSSGAVLPPAFHPTRTFDRRRLQTRGPGIDL